MSQRTLLRHLALVSAIVGATFVTSAGAALFSSGTGSITSFPNSIKLTGTLTCNLPNLGIYIDTNASAPELVLTDKSALAGSFDPNNPPGTLAVCTETPLSGSPVQGTGTFQQLDKSGQISAGGGQGPNPTGLVVETIPNNDGTTTHTLRFYVDDRASTDERARYQITFPADSPLCVGVTNPNACVHKMGLPDPLNAGESEINKGSTTFPATTVAPIFEQYVMEKMAVKVDAAGAPIAFTDFQARWLHNGSEDGTDPVVESVSIRGQTTKLRTAAETALDILVEVQVSPVVTSDTGVTSIHVLSSAEFDAPTAINAAEAKTIEVNGKTVLCRNTSTNDINGDGRNDWRCAAEKSEFINAANLQNCTGPTATVAFAVRVVFGGKLRWARDAESTFPVNCK
jgi:hypothetical protein